MWLAHNFFYSESLEFTGIISIAVSIVSIVVSLVCIGIDYGRAEGVKEEYKIAYESLTYQLENDIYDNDDDVVGKKELYNQIQAYNQEIASGKKIQRNFWIGIYYPNIYDDLKIIKYKEIKDVEN